MTRATRMGPLRRIRQGNPRSRRIANILRLLTIAMPIAILVMRDRATRLDTLLPRGVRRFIVEAALRGS